MKYEVKLHLNIIGMFPTCYRTGVYDQTTCSWVGLKIADFKQCSGGGWFWAYSCIKGHVTMLLWRFGVIWLAKDHIKHQKALSSCHILFKWSYMVKISSKSTQTLQGRPLAYGLRAGNVKMYQYEEALKSPILSTLLKGYIWPCKHLLHHVYKLHGRFGIIWTTKCQSKLSKP